MLKLSFLIIFQSFMILLCNNTLLCILFLISIYLFTSIFFFLLGVEFFGILLIIIYVGAISILFIFVIMMLNLRIVEVYHTTIVYLPIGLFLGLFFFV